jgi:hypothetical protein
MYTLMHNNRKIKIKICNKKLQYQLLVGSISTLKPINLGTHVLLFIYLLKVSLVNGSLV